MENNTTDLLNQLLGSGTIKAEIQERVQTEINRILQEELSAFLGYEKNSSEGWGSGNSRNGKYNRKIDTAMGVLEIEVPRDRNGEFVQHTIPAYDRHATDITNIILELYCYGNTTRDISDIVSHLYGSYYSPTTISNFTKTLDTQAKFFRERKFTKNYPFIFLDATYLNLRRDSVGKEALHVILGITADGKKEILTAGLFPTESAKNYETLLEDLKERGVTGVLLAISDGLIGMEDMIHRVYPAAEHQSCWVHISRNIERMVRQKDRASILSDLKLVYNADSESSAKNALDDFLKRYSHIYPKLATYFEHKTNLFSFYHYPESIRKTIYTTNLIESNNKYLKRKIKAKEQFPNESALERFISVRYLAYNKKMSSQTHYGFRTAEYELNQLIESRYENKFTQKC